MVKKILVIGVALLACFIFYLAQNDADPNIEQQEDEVMSPETDPNNGDDAEDPSEEPSKQVEDPTLPEADIQKMDQGKSVQELQESLQRIGYAINVTSKYDDETTWAITDFQLQNEKLDATGIYDNQTKERLQDALDEKLSIEPGSRLSKPKQAQHTKKTRSEERRVGKECKKRRVTK